MDLDYLGVIVMPGLLFLLLHHVGDKEVYEQVLLLHVLYDVGLEVVKQQLLLLLVLSHGLGNRSLRAASSPCAGSCWHRWVASDCHHIAGRLEQLEMNGVFRRMSHISLFDCWLVGELDIDHADVLDLGLGATLGLKVGGLVDVILITH